MAATPDAFTSFASTVQNPSFSHTCTGSDLYLIVAVSMDVNNGESVTGVTYNSISMTKLVDITHSGNRIYSSLWGLVNPATGSNTVLVSTTFSGAGKSGGAASFTDVHQTTSEGTPQSAEGSGATSSTLGVASGSGEIVVDNFAMRSSQTPVVVAGQTQRWNVVSSFMRSAFSTDPTGGSTENVGWTFTSDDFAHVAISLKPTAGAPAGAPLAGSLSLMGMGW